MTVSSEHLSRTPITKLSAFRFDRLYMKMNDDIESTHVSRFGAGRRWYYPGGPSKLGHLWPRLRDRGTWVGLSERSVAGFRKPLMFPT